MLTTNPFYSLAFSESRLVHRTSSAGPESFSESDEQNQPNEEAEVTQDVSSRFVESFTKTFDALRSSLGASSEGGLQDVLSNRISAVTDRVSIDSEKMKVALKDLPDEIQSLVKEARRPKDGVGALPDILLKINDTLQGASTEKRQSWADSIVAYLNANLLDGSVRAEDGEVVEVDEGEESEDSAEETEEAAEEEPESQEEIFMRRLGVLFEKVLSLFTNREQTEVIAPNALLGDKLNLTAQRFDIIEGARKIRSSKSAIDAIIGNPRFVSEYQVQPEVPQTAVQVQQQCQQCQAQAVQRVTQQTDLLRDQWEFLNKVEVALPQYLSSVGLSHIQVGVNRNRGQIEFRGMRGKADSQMLKSAVYERMPPGMSAILPTGDSRQTYSTLKLNQSGIQGLRLLLGNAIKTPGEMVQDQIADMNLPDGAVIENMYVNAGGTGPNRFGVPDGLLRAKENYSRIPAPVDIPYSEGKIVFSCSPGLGRANNLLQGIPGNRGENNSGFMINNREGRGKFTENLQRLGFNERWDPERLKQPQYKEGALRSMGIEVSDASFGGVNYATRVEFTRPIPPGEWVQINGQKYYGSMGGSKIDGSRYV